MPIAVWGKQAAVWLGLQPPADFLDQQLQLHGQAVTVRFRLVEDLSCAANWHGFVVVFDGSERADCELAVRQLPALRVRERLLSECVLYVSVTTNPKLAYLQPVLERKIPVLSAPAQAVLPRLLRSVGVLATLPSDFVSSSQIGQDEWVAAEVYRGLRAGTFLDIGAADGKSLSNTWALERFLGWQCICIEASSQHFRSLQKNRGSGPSQLVQACLGVTKGQRVRFVEAGDFSHVVTDDEDKQQPAVTTYLTTSVITEYLGQAPTFIHYLSLDIEGGELDVLLTFPFDKYTVGALTVEHNWQAVKRLAIRSLLESKGYRFCREKDFDDFYVHQSLYHDGLSQNCEPVGCGVPLGGTTLKTGQWVSLLVESNRLLITAPREQIPGYNACFVAEPLQDCRRQRFQFIETALDHQFLLRLDRTDTNKWLVPAGGCGAREGAYVHPYVLSTAQRPALLWRFESVDNDRFRLLHVQTGCYLTVEGGEQADEQAKLQLWSSNPLVVKAQTFRLASTRLPDWRCKHHRAHRHDVFISYRVRSDASIARELFWALSAQRLQDGSALAVFLDKFCLNDGEEWEKGFLDGLDQSAVIVLLLSSASLERIRYADKQQDNVLLEIEYALEKLDKGAAKIYHLALDDLVYDPLQFPDAKHATPKSAHHVRETMKRLFALQIPTMRLDQLLPHLAAVLELAKALRATNPDGAARVQSV